MKMEHYVADMGTVLFVKGSGSFRVGNRIGDGWWKIYLFDNYQEFDDYKQEHYQYEGMQDKDYHLDALLTGAWEVKSLDTNIDSATLFELNGKYDVYINKGKVYLVCIVNY